jgi:tRNA A-37 threonylcarbamoyl transferase component Bud32
MKNKLAQEITWKGLLHGNNETMMFPFQLTLMDSGPLICEKILRIVPGRRLVALGTWQGQPVVAKCFYDRDAKHHMMRDIKGAEILQQANVPTPRLLYQTTAHKHRTHLILFEKIEEAIPLDRIWQQKEDYLAINALMHSFTIELATQHVLGILQHDLHLNNFLVTDKRIYTLDGGTITQFDAPLDKKNSLENLGLFFAQLGAGTGPLKQELFQVYVKARGWLVKKADLLLLQSSFKTSWKERWRHYHKKIFRNCTTFKKIKTLFKSIIYDRAYQSPAFLNVLNHPDDIFTDPNTVLLKKGRSSTVAKIIIDQRVLVIKRYNIKNGLHWLRRCCRDTRAKQAWCLAQRLCLFGVSTARPIAYIENHVLGLRGTSYFLMEHVEGQDSGTFFSAYEPHDPCFETVAKRILKLIHDLSELQMVHGDLKKTNIIIHRDRPFLIDLDGMSQYKLALFFKRAYKKEIKRFMRNWNAMPSVFSLFDKLMYDFL